MFSHVTVGSRDVAKAKPFYDGIAKALGLVRNADYPEAVGYGRPGGRPQLWVVRPFDKNAASVGNGVTIGLEASDRPAVDAAYAAAMANGGTDEGKPGLRPHYHPNYYGTYVRDPDGNKICIACHRPA
jgi:catechol 2,3-dioxygenase-like lactoylglutathione lyase family enzyme